MKKSVCLASSHISDAAKHLERDALVSAMGLRFMNPHARGAAPETASLFAVKQARVLAFPSAIPSLWTNVVLRFPAQAGLMVANLCGKLKLTHQVQIVCA